MVLHRQTSAATVSTQARRGGANGIRRKVRDDLAGVVVEPMAHATLAPPGLRKENRRYDDNYRNQNPGCED